MKLKKLSKKLYNFHKIKIVNFFGETLHFGFLKDVSKKLKEREVVTIEPEFERPEGSYLIIKIK